MTLDAYRKWSETEISGKPHLSIVIPVYNEEWRIVPTIGTVAAFVSQQGYDWELIIADDGSKDDSVSLVNELGLVNMQVLEAEANTGKGGAVSRGVAAATGDYILFLDADQSTPIEQLPEFLDAVKSKEADIAIGSRRLAGSQVANKSGFRNLLSDGLNTVVSSVFRLPYADTQCGFKLFEGKLAKELFSKSRIEGFSFDLELLYAAKVNNVKVLEIPVEWHDAPDSKVSGAKVALKFLADMPTIILNRVLGRYRLDNLAR